MIVEIDYAGRQMRGGRERQEDAYAFSDILGHDEKSEGLLVVVADGMGGHTSGETASVLAMEAFVDRFHRETGPIQERLQNSMTASNFALAEKFKRVPELKGMGTTLLAAAVTLHGVHWISVGDSMLYLLRKGELKRLNADHSFRSFLDIMIQTGELTPEKAARHPFRNLLRSALQGDDIELTDSPEHPLGLQEGDLILAATDGLQTIPDAEIEQLLAKAPAGQAAWVAESLLQTVKKCKKPKQDNATVTVIRFATKSLSAKTASPTRRSKTVVRKPGKRR